MASTFVKDIMKTNVITIDESLTILDAAQMMTDAGVESVIVTRKNNPVGIITEGDFTRIAAEGRPLFTQVSEVMSAPLIVVNPDKTAWDASEIMTINGIHKLPVQDRSKIVGIVTTIELAEICSWGSDFKLRRICAEMLLRMKGLTH